MSESIIIFGEINKKLLLPVFLTLGKIILDIFNEYYPEEANNFVLDLYSISLGQIAIIFLPYILHIHNKNNKSNNDLYKKKKFSHYFLLCFFRFLNFLIILITLVVKNRFAENSLEVPSPKSIETFFEQGIQMFLLAFISFFLLKYRYYLHNIIALILFLISGLGNDLIVGYFKLKIKEHFIVIIIDYIYILIDCMVMCYEKYMMEKLYYSYWNISLILGLFLFVFATIALIVILILGKESDISFVKGFYNYFETTNIGIIGKEIITSILYFIEYALLITTLLFFNPEYILISVQFSKLVNLLIEKSKDESHNKNYFFF